MRRLRSFPVLFPISTVSPLLMSACFDRFSPQNLGAGYRPTQAASPTHLASFQQHQSWRWPSPPAVPAVVDPPAACCSAWWGSVFSTSYSHPWALGLFFASRAGLRRITATAPSLWPGGAPAAAAAATRRIPLSHTFLFLRLVPFFPFGGDCGSGLRLVLPHLDVSHTLLTTAGRRHMVMTSFENRPARRPGPHHRRAGQGRLQNPGRTAASADAGSWPHWLLVPILQRWRSRKVAAASRRHV